MIYETFVFRAISSSPEIAQFEHTIRVSSKGTINYTLGEDY